MNPHDPPDYKRVFIALLLASLVLFAWQSKVEWPRRQQLAQFEMEQAKRQAAKETQLAAAAPAKDIAENPELTWQQRIAGSPRIAIDSATLHGSIALKGARFDDLTLQKYKETQDADSPNVTLLSPNGGEAAYFAQVGWVSPDNKTKVPDQNSLWQADKKTLAPGQTVTLRWNNGENITFILLISLDEHYMFSIVQEVENHSGSEINVTPYAYINRTYAEPKQANMILHQGPLGVMDGSLSEATYKELREKGNKIYDNASGWFGITDKYWLAALIPTGKGKVTFSYYASNNRDRYQTDYLGDSTSIAAGATGENGMRFFAGAKEINLLDQYAKGDAAQNIPPIPLFDRSIDFGMLYFLTKPMLLTLTFFHGLVGNFGIAIMLLTIVVRILLYPLASKSFHATAKMRDLQPQMLKLREKYFDDQITLQKEMMALYKREKVNPAAGCLPVLIQMPVFFSLYKVLYVSIEMRQAPFFGWIKDLSVMDPLNIFTGFGLIPWEPFAWMHLGILPMLMCATMIIQMKQQPKPADPTQARMMAWMPYLMLLIFAKMPAGLIVYWTWSNIISIIQQRVITKHHQFNMARKQKKAAA